MQYGICSGRPVLQALRLEIAFFFFPWGFVFLRSVLKPDPLLQFPAVVES